MADKLMCIANDDTQNIPFCRLHLVVETFGQSTLLNQNSDRQTDGQTNRHIELQSTFAQKKHILSTCHIGHTVDPYSYLGFSNLYLTYKNKHEKFFFSQTFFNLHDKKMLIYLNPLSVCSNCGCGQGGSVVVVVVVTVVVGTVVVVALGVVVFGVVVVGGDLLCT